MDVCRDREKEDPKTDRYVLFLIQFTSTTPATLFALYPMRPDADRVVRSTLRFTPSWIVGPNS